MPQRTRQQKIEAAKRRQFRLILDEPTTTTPQTAPTRNTVESTKDEEISPVRRYLTTDLRKSLILIVIIFALEFFLYFVRIG